MSQAWIDNIQSLGIFLLALNGIWQTRLHYKLSERVLHLEYPNYDPKK